MNNHCSSWYRIIIAGLLFAVVAFPGGLSVTAHPFPAPGETIPTDGYGYLINEVEDQWVDANPAGDPGILISFPYANGSYAGPFEIGFPFRFYENTYTSFYIHTSGMITLSVYPNSKSPKPIPWTSTPNNLIAPYWADLKLNSEPGDELQMFGKVILNKTTPGITVVEWELYSDSSHTTLIGNFEVILYSNDQIVFQYNMTGGLPAAHSIGIEDADGINGLEYTDPVSSSTDLRFIPPNPTPRVNILPRYQGGFVTGERGYYNFAVKNNGEWGADRYNLSVISSSPGWQTAFLSKATGLPLVDTDLDGIPDTGSIPQGSARGVILQTSPPSGAPVGAHTEFTVAAVSDLAPIKVMTATIQSAIPGEFVQLFANTNGIQLSQIWKENSIKHTVEARYSSGSLSVESISNDVYLSTWETTTAQMADGRWLDGVRRLEHGELQLEDGSSIAAPTGLFTDIKYRLVNRITGAGPEYNLTNTSELVTGNVFDVTARTPAISSAPSGHVGIAWAQTKTRDNLGANQKNSNTFFAILTSTGQLAAPRINVTASDLWYPEDEGRDIESPSITITGDARYHVCWIEPYLPAVRCAVYGFDGTTISTIAPPFTPATIPTGSKPQNLTLTRLANNHVLITYTEAYDDEDKIVYLVLNSDGSVFRGRTEIPGASGNAPRAVQFSANENVLIVWVQSGGSLFYSYLDGTYNPMPGFPRSFDKVNRRSVADPSITMNREGLAVITWVDPEKESIFYAVLGANQNVVTPAMIFINNRSTIPEFVISEHGFSNAMYSGVYLKFLPTIMR